MNSVNLIGHLTREVQMSETQNGAARISGTLAVKCDFRNEDGSRDTTFIRFVAFGKLAEIIQKYTTKGSHIGIQGWLDNYSFEKNNETRYVSQVVVKDISFLDTKEQTNRLINRHENNDNTTSEEALPQNTPITDVFTDSEEVTIPDDELPF
ncbi:single-stranded DNA-binding protein [Weissella minor]|uniref:single-stranded DNA-binding protein n=1 Tax=Weissella minor TaxID=1620 RepID=UPI003AF2D561